MGSFNCRWFIRDTLPVLEVHVIDLAGGGMAVLPNVKIAARGITMK
jgi:hypothetical protein